MTLIIISFLAGVLTVLAPCTLPVLPLIIGGSISGNTATRKQTLIRALVIVSSLAASIFIFTLLLKASTSLLGIPQIYWKILSGGIVLLLGINFLFPKLWQILSIRLNLQINSNKELGKAQSHKGMLGAVLTGAALGPVFSSCSPTYALIVALLLNAAFLEGITYLVAYILGMAVLLLLVAYFGSRFVHKLGWALDEHGIFRKVIAVIFIIIGLAVLTGLDKQFETSLLDAGFYDGTSGLEQQFNN